MRLFTISGKVYIDDKTIKVKGLASTEDIDREGEIILKEGINFDPLLSYGYITYEHNPFDVIGVPTDAKITNKGLEITGELFANHPRVKWLLKTNEILKGQRLGERGIKLSIEGYPKLRRGNKIARVDVVNVAVTLVPVNPKTKLEFLTKSLDIPFKEFYDNYLCHHIFKEKCECLEVTDLLKQVKKEVIVKSLLKTLRAGHTVKREELRDGGALMRDSIEGDRDKEDDEDELKEWDEYIHILDFRDKKFSKIIDKLKKYGYHPALVLSIFGNLLRLRKKVELG